MVFISIDPGRDKCGLALMGGDGAAREMRAVPAGRLAEEVGRWMERDDVRTIVVGDGTGCREIVAGLRSKFPSAEVEVVDEKGTTLEARRLFFRENPGKRFWSVFPFSLFAPAFAVDEYAAVVIGRRFLG